MRAPKSKEFVFPTLGQESEGKGRRSIFYIAAEFRRVGHDLVNKRAEMPMSMDVLEVDTRRGSKGKISVLLGWVVGGEESRRQDDHVNEYQDCDQGLHRVCSDRMRGSTMKSNTSARR